jgi:ribonuclease P protein component
MKENGFPTHLRLRRTADFEQVYDKGRRLGDGHLLLFALPSVPGAVRAGFSVSRKHGNAVRRNRRKRLLREAFRLHRVQLPLGYDFVLVPRQREDSTLQDYSRSLLTLARRLHRQFMTANANSPTASEPGTVQTGPSAAT